MSGTVATSLLTDLAARGKLGEDELPAEIAGEYPAGGFTVSS